MLRPEQYKDFTHVSQDAIDYAAGLIDADGNVSDVATRISITQSLRGIDCLYFMYDTFGGRIDLHKEGNEQHQTSFTWVIAVPTYSNAFCKRIVDSLLLKKREVELLLTYYESDDNFVRLGCKKMIREYHNTPHDDIPVHIKPSNAYFGGFMDGEGCLNAKGKNIQHHSFDQRHRPICDLFERNWFGKVSHIKPKDTYRWEIHTMAGTFLAAIAPYMVGKKKQVELIMNMQPGEGDMIHAKLRELKGNCTAPTPRIDAYNSGNAIVYKQPVKKLPKGVYLSSENRYMVKIRHKNKEHCLGTFDTIDEAAEQYNTYKRKVEEEKRNGPVVDLSFNTIESKKTPPPANGIKLPQGVYVTKSHRFQTRFRHGGMTHQLGTHLTVELATEAIENFKKNLISQGEQIKEKGNYTKDRSTK